MLLDRLAGYARPRRRPEVLVWTIAVVLCLPIQHGSTADVPQKATHAVGHGSEQPHQPQLPSLTALLVESVAKLL
jgi:hypothetical protein